MNYRLLKKTLLLSLMVMLLTGICFTNSQAALPYYKYGEYEGLAPSYMILTIDNVSSRSGPGTEYRETGTYKVKGQYLPVISIAFDEENNIFWLQCEIKYQNQLRRVYTGMKRFDQSYFESLVEVPYEFPKEDPIKVLKTSKAMYGPGEGYDTYSKLTVDKGQMVTLVAIENDYAMVEWTTSIQSYRAWVPVSTLAF